MRIMYPRVDETQRHRRQRHIAQEGQKSVRERVLIARRGQHAKIHRKEQHHAQTHQEARQRNAQHRQHRHEIISNRAALLRRQHPARNRNQNGDELRIDGEQDGRLEVAGNHFADRLSDHGG